MCYVWEHEMVGVEVEMFEVLKSPHFSIQNFGGSSIQDYRSQSRDCLLGLKMAF